jgi:hypothetical protein
MSSGDITFAGMGCIGMNEDMADAGSTERGLCAGDGTAGKVAY